MAMTVLEALRQLRRGGARVDRPSMASITYLEAEKRRARHQELAARVSLFGGTRLITVAPHTPRKSRRAVDAAAGRPNEEQAHGQRR